MLCVCLSGLQPGPDLGISENAVGVWDSLAAVTVAAVVQEEFNVEIDPEVLPLLGSFEMYRSYLDSINSTLE